MEGGTHMAVRKNRSVELSAVNCFRTLMEKHDFIVQEIDGRNDNGEDFYVSFTEQGERTGDTIAVQIKGGASYRTASGYRVPIKQHLEYWSKSNTPVYCVVQDPDSQALFWANASAQIRAAKKKGKAIRSIRIDPADELCDDTVLTFILRARLYVSETGDFHKFLTRLSGVVFAPTDYLAYFESIFDERMIFRQAKEEPAATLLHSDLDWDPIRVTDEDIAFNKPSKFFRRAPARPAFYSPGDENATLKDVILSRSERMWIEACFQESQWIRLTREEQTKKDRLYLQRVPPILYSPLDEIEVADRPWRNDPYVNDLMEKFINLGYSYWDRLLGRQSPTSSSPGSHEATWSELEAVVHLLKNLKVPSYYLMGNRGQLTRSEMKQLLRR